ncbi:hypothetical protein RIF23_02090 [Lipingzhangella sp. LS1_29]|uniref:Uncharacterized protein n=1 Tax=Lipingzhangella rawalii TaxID=2055835 RepID=A0ABU2H1A9_9ACTN|nr:hypothetical protein [Lipingzhangella rawalii]MDS1269081.1 hypothetical protein [Lipingzhangella rawalii]
MSSRGWMIAGGVGAGLLLLWLLPGWLTLLVVLAVVGVPIAGYLMLDPSQRRRLGRAAGRGRLGP